MLATREILDLLADEDEITDATSVIGVVRDVGRALVRPDLEEQRMTLARLAHLREKLEQLDDLHGAPATVLREAHKHPAYLAGALWATSHVLHAYLDRVAAHDQWQAERPRRELIAEVVNEVLHDQGVGRPRDFLERLGKHGIDAAPADLSKALRQLLEDGVIEQSGGPDGSDRRGRWYRRPGDGRGAEHDRTVPAHLVRAIKKLAEGRSPSDVREMLDAVLAEVA